MLLHQLSKPGNGKRMANSSTDCFRAAIFPFTSSSSASLALNSLSVGPQLLWISCDNLIPEDTRHKQLKNAYTEYTARLLFCNLRSLGHNKLTDNTLLHVFLCWCYKSFTSRIYHPLLQTFLLLFCALITRKLHLIFFKIHKYTSFLIGAPTTWIK